MMPFFCRGNLVQTGFQKSAGNYLIKSFKPIWNSETKICFGLGKHGDSSETRSTSASVGHAACWSRVRRRDDGQSKTAGDDHRTDWRPPGDALALCQHPQIFERFTEDMHQLNLESFSTPAGGGVELELGGDASPEQLACAIGDHRRQLHWHSVTIPVAGSPGTTRRRLRREA